jgi:hypothetical protein
VPFIDQTEARNGYRQLAFGVSDLRALDPSAWVRMSMKPKHASPLALGSGFP